MWQVLNEKVVDYQGYQDKVSRRLAIVRLSPTPQV